MLTLTPRAITALDPDNTNADVWDALPAYVIIGRLELDSDAARRAVLTHLDADLSRKRAAAGRCAFYGFMDALRDYRGAAEEIASKRAKLAAAWSL